jgi:hypothetical protein
MYIRVDVRATNPDVEAHRNLTVCGQNGFSAAGHDGVTSRSSDA